MSSNELSREERFWIIRRKHWDNGWEFPWDKMAIPTHEWFDNYKKVYKTNIDIKTPKTLNECEDWELEDINYIRKNYE